MNRRRFITRALALGSGMAGSLIASPAQSGVFEHLLTGVDQTRGTLLDRIDIALRNANKIFRGIYHGYGLGIQKVLEETDELLPTTPKRGHPGWPHVHCVCHCNAVANLGEEDGIQISRFAGMADELNQAFFSQMFYDIVYPLTWKDLLGQHSERGGLKRARLEMKYVMDYSFGDVRTRRRALGLASISDRKNNAALKDYRSLIYGLVDALESTWQQSDLHDNALGREGGIRCPKGLTAKKKRKWCSGWCAQNGVPPNVAEGPGTPRPWGPFHPLNPGPVPTMHDTLYGRLRKPFDPKLNVPPPEFVPILRPVLEGFG